MASNFFIEEDKLIWKIVNPTDGNTRASPRFTLFDINYFLRYGMPWDCAVSVSNVSDEITKRPLDITLSVENGHLKNTKSALKLKKHISEFDRAEHVICRWDKDKMEEILSQRDRCLATDVLQLTFEFYSTCRITPKLQVTSIKSELQELSDPCFDSLSKDMRVLLTDNSLSDVELKCGDGSVKAHKNILSTRSKVFAAMLKNDMEETRNLVVKIEGLRVDVLKKFLQYIYTGTLSNLTTDNAYILYDAGEKYAVLGLKRRCAVYLEENLSEANACETLVTASLHSDEKFKEKVITYILEKKIPGKKDIWTAFRKNHLDLASEVLTRYYELQNQ